MADDKILDLKGALEDLADDMEIYKEVLIAYMEDTPGMIEEMSLAVENRDTEVLSRHAHSLKSSSRSIGGMRLGNIAAELEANTKAGGFDGAKELIEKIKKEFNALKQELAKTDVLE